MARVHVEVSPGVVPRSRTKGETYEGLAFTFCKAATLILLTQRFALPVAAGAAAVFYLLAYSHDKKDTRCVLRFPLAIAAFWGGVAVFSLYTIIRPLVGR